MNIWIQSAILATTLLGAVAVGIASASTGGSAPAAAKADRLPIATDAPAYVTVEARGDGVSILKRIPLD